MTNQISESLETYRDEGSRNIRSSRKRSRGRDVDHSVESQQKRRRESQIATRAQSQLKRSRASFEESSEDEREVKRIDLGEREEGEHRVPLMIRRLDPVIEIQREDAFPLGVQAANQYQMDLIAQMGDEALEELEFAVQAQEEEATVGVDLKRYQYKEIDEIAKTKDQKIGSQFFELYQMLESRNYTRKAEGKAILEFAKQIISSIPDDEPMEMEIDDEDIEVPEEFMEIAEMYLDKLPFDLPELNVKRLASAMQNAVEKHAGDEEDGSEEVSERDQQIDLAMRRLGYLLLLTQHNISLTAKCINSFEFEDALNNISDCVSEILEEAAERVQEHTSEHERSAIQSSDEATFHRMSLEMAKVLLLDTGSINFGMIEAAAQVLIPEHLKETVAIDNLWLVLDELATNPMIWERIAKTKPPESKDIPSDPAIRACFGLDNDQEITRRHAQLFVLSALLGHMRQAKAGTCFATACLIKAKYYHTIFFVQDLSDMTEKGYVSRMLFRENRDFPFQARVTKEYLDVEVTVNKKGQLLSTKRYDLMPDKADEWPRPEKGAYLHESPGIRSACQAMGISNVEEAVGNVLNRMPEKFPINDLLKELANYAFLQQESALYWFRSQERLTVDELVFKAQFAFGVQTNHPLHRFYEQVSTSMVNYFGAQYMMPAWVSLTVEEVLGKSASGYSRSFQTKYRKLIQEIFLPMICRMRYTYNPNFDKVKKLFDDGNYGIKESHFYGYQLCDTGLPGDFEYSNALYKSYHNSSSHIKLERFKEYAPPHRWRSIETAEKFQEFVKDVITETVEHLKEGASSARECAQWDDVAEKMLTDVSKPTFSRKMIFKLFGKDGDQKKEFRKDEYNMRSTPWQFGWGGDFNEVLKTFFGFDKEPSKLRPYNGSPKEVLAKCINYIKKQPEDFKEEYDNPRNQIIVSSPVHVFLLRPFEPTFQDAWKSDISTNDYIDENVLEPGLEVANSRLHIRQRKELLSFVANNMWVTRYFEKEDWVRQQLTEDSKKIFDQKISKAHGLLQMTVEDFQETVVDIVIASRAGDKKIGRRNIPWEARFKRVFNNCVKMLVPNESARQRTISTSVAMKLLDFARNREDSVRLTPVASKRFLELMEQTPKGCSVKEFREAIVKASYKARCEYLCGNDPDWKGKFCEHLDTKLFSILSGESKENLISSGIVTHDTNWKEQIHNIHFIFMVNPGTGNIEMCRFHPDTQQVEFMNQSEWFPRKLKGHGYWQFPDNYRVWKEAPLFNVKEHMDM